jgi:hypothetical protein
MGEGIEGDNLSIDIQEIPPIDPASAIAAVDDADDPFRFLAPEYALPVLDMAAPPCPHPRVTRQKHWFYQRSPEPFEAHQCLLCGGPVSAEDVSRRRLDRENV